MIESIAKIFAESGPIGLVIFGCFALAIVALLVNAYILLQMLASIQDDKKLKFENGLYADRRRNKSRPVKLGVLMRIVRKIRGVHE